MEFIYQFDQQSPRIHITLNAYASLSEVLEQFEVFLRAAGYTFDGTLDFVSDENGETND